jgi:hypothetical protein
MDLENLQLAEKPEELKKVYIEDYLKALEQLSHIFMVEADKAARLEQFQLSRDLLSQARGLVLAMDTYKEFIKIERGPEAFTDGFQYFNLGEIK